MFSEKPPDKETVALINEFARESCQRQTTMVLILDGDSEILGGPNININLYCICLCEHEICAYADPVQI